MRLAVHRAFTIITTLADRSARVVAQLTLEAAEALFASLDKLVAPEPKEEEVL